MHNQYPDSMSTLKKQHQYIITSASECKDLYCQNHNHIQQPLIVIIDKQFIYLQIK